MTEAAIPLRDTSSISRYPIGMQLRLGTQRSVWTRIFYIQSTHDIFLSLYTALFGLRLLQSNPAMIGQQQPGSSHGSSGVKDRASATTAAPYGSSSIIIAFRLVSSSSSLLDENTGEEGALVSCEVGVL